MCKVWRGFPLHTSTNPAARTTIAPPGMPDELLPGIFLLEVFQVICPICQCFMHKKQSRIILFDDYEWHCAYCSHWEFVEVNK